MDQIKHPIQYKIGRAILITSTAVLVLTGVAYLVYEYFTFREAVVNRMSVLGEVIANTSTAALAFDNREEAYEILSALRAQEHIVAATLYDEDRLLFSSFPKDIHDEDLPDRLTEDGYYFEGDHLHGFHPIILGTKRIGTLYIKYDLVVLSRQFRFLGMVALLVFILSLLLAWLLSYKLQQRISKPIITLANVARSISANKDFSVRAVKQTDDEIGLLTTAFNQMLNQIEAQNIALRESEEFSRSLLESSPDCVIALDLQGKLLSINPRGQHMLEMEEVDRYMGQMWWDLWTDEYKPAIMDAMEKARQGEICHFQGLSPTTKGNFRWWDVLVAPIFGANEKAERLVSVSRDITKLKELEQQKDDFISIASHELKTPVTSIKAFTQILQRRFQESTDELSSELLGKMNMQLNKLTKLIHDLLDVTRIEQGKIQFRNERFDFNELVNDVVEEIQRTTIKHQIRQELGPTRMVHGDRDRIGQVITNFLANAIKYSPKSDQILVNTGMDSPTSIRLSVQDFGVGLADDDLERVFERFYRVEGTGYETFPGLGLGLFISAGIIQRHRGHIWVESEKGKGSTFHFSLPLID